MDTKAFVFKLLKNGLNILQLDQYSFKIIGKVWDSLNCEIHLNFYS